MAYSSSNSSSATQSFDDKQLIVVLPDRVVAASRKAEAKASKSNQSFDYSDIAGAALKIISNPLYFAMYFAIKEGVAAWSRARQVGLNVKQVSCTEASKLKFPPGHPRDGFVYVQHPAQAGIYYTISSFHRMAFEHKFSEAINILMHLGATRINVEHMRGWSRDFASQLSVSIPQSTTGGATASHSGSSKASLLFEAKLAGNTNPRLPENLVWYPHEPTWNSVATGRINFGLSEFSMAVNYEEDFGINVGLKAEVQKAGLELGGNFESHVSTAWKLTGEFKNP